MNLKKEKYELRSAEVQELLGRVPGWVIRWGTIVVLSILIILFLLSMFLSYPDVISSQVTLTANVPPAEMKANTDGTIRKILVVDQAIVEKGQLLAVIHSAADFNDVLWLSKSLPDSFSVEAILIQLNIKKQLQLGGIQPFYADYRNSLEEYQGFIDLDFYEKKSEATKIELQKYRIYTSNLRAQKKVLNEEYQLVYSKYKRDSLLTEKGVLSQKDLEITKEEMLSGLYHLKEEESKYSQTRIEIVKLEQALLDLELQLEQQNQRLYSNLKSKFEKLNGSISEWKKDFLIESPFQGSVSMSKIWSENQYVRAGEVVLTIIPKDYERIVGRILIQPQGAGKIKVEDKIIIRFDNYPYLEYGVVTGKISTMSQALEGGLYYASVAIDSATLVTNYNKHLKFSQNMQGSAEIITESRSLLDRIIAPLRSAIEIQQMYNDEN